jgi:hypothetical protein
MKQTTISAWIYLSIFFVLALIIVLCVGWRASRENPAAVVKSEFFHSFQVFIFAKLDKILRTNP